MQRLKSNALPPYLALPFSSLDDVTEFLRQLEVDCIRRGRPSDGTVNIDTFSRCLQLLGRPDRAYRSIHITGTNGKTNVARMIAALIQGHGTKVGLYTSPHIGPFQERMAINGEAIGERKLLEVCNHVKSLMDWTGIEITPFEFLTAAALFAFRLTGVEYAVIEVGIGGRRDATNLISPEVSVITNVAHDHMELLGDTLEKIALEKAGIIKPLTPVVCGPMPAGPLAVVRECVKNLRAPALFFGEDYEIQAFAPAAYGGTCTVRVGPTSWSDIPLSGPAEVMATNAAHALAVYDILRQRGLVSSLDPSAVAGILEQVHVPGCCEVLDGQPTILLDGARNATAAAALVSTLRYAFEGRRIVLLVSVQRGKEYRQIIQQLTRAGVERVIFPQCPSETAEPPDKLADLWRSQSRVAGEIVMDPDAAFYRSLEVAGPAGIVVATGSLELESYYRSLAKDAVCSLDA